MERTRRERSASLGMLEKWCKRKREESGEEMGGEREENRSRREAKKIQRLVSL